MNIGTICSVTIPKQESESVMLCVQIERDEDDQKYCYYLEGPRFDTCWVKRAVYDAHPDLYVCGSVCNVRYTKDPKTGRYFTNIYF